MSLEEHELNVHASYIFIHFISTMNISAWMLWIRQHEPMMLDHVAKLYFYCFCSSFSQCQKS